MSEKLGLTADEVLTTTRAVRKRIDFDRPVERTVIEECVEIALQAPTGSNTQGWRWMFVTDPDKKATIADLYRANFYPYISQSDNASNDQGSRILSSAKYMAERLHEVPVMAIPCIAGRMGPGASSFEQASTWGSILPAVWSFCLALRERGLGSSWTTLHLPNEAETAELLGIPYDRYTQVGLFPIGYTVGTDFKVASREPASRWIHWDQW
ncbi:MAG: nitroreductase family protein [Acidimicrobiia bacterium]|nr:nitroreductase family protein [Acidimicrobiia bacterium]MDH5238197.1 nitroreductase family protein [Acidimicrobiia bacterium]